MVCQMAFAMVCCVPVLMYFIALYLLSFLWQPSPLRPSNCVTVCIVHLQSGVGGAVVTDYRDFPAAHKCACIHASFFGFVFFFFSEKMLAAYFDCPGGPENLYVKKVMKPHPGEGEVLVKVAASALNRADLLQVCVC